MTPEDKIVPNLDSNEDCNLFASDEKKVKSNSIDLSSIDEITKKLRQANELGIMMVIVHKPQIENGQAGELYPDVIACNFTDWKLAAAMLGNEVADAEHE